MSSKMRTKLAFLVVTAAFFLSFVHSFPHTLHDINPRTPAYFPLRILPLGDSITWGWQPEHKEDGTNGYREKLLLNLLTSGFNLVDFVGTQHSGLMFDNENEGHSGFTISQIRNATGPGLELKPNIILLHAGTNDLIRPETPEETWEDAPIRLGALIDDILEALPRSLVIVARIIPTVDAQTAENIEAFNEELLYVVAERVNQGSRVTLVDQSVIEVDELIDGVHPTDAGYDHMGDIWFEGILLASEQGLITPPV